VKDATDAGKRGYVQSAEEVHQQRRHLEANMEEKRSRVLRALKHAPLHAKDFQYTDSVSSRV